MTQKELMLKGDLYDATFTELFNERNWCKDKCYQYNNLKPSLTE